MTDGECAGKGNVLAVRGITSSGRVFGRAFEMMEWSECGILFLEQMHGEDCFDQDVYDYNGSIKYQLSGCNCELWVYSRREQNKQT